jgi:glycosyltransferase involved in cell wall biosynthesis
MRILILADDFFPEVNASAQRMYEKARYWAKMNYQVTVITGAPNAPQGKIYPGYRNKWYQEEMIDGIRIIRVKTFIAARKGIFLRIVDHLSFMVMSFITGLFVDKADVIVATSPQFFTLVSGWLLAFFKRKTLILEIADLWPASIVAVDLMQENILLRMIEKLELFLYRRAAAIVALTQYIKNDMVRRGINANKITVICNGVDKKNQPEAIKIEQLRKEANLANKFIVGYIGNHGLANGLENVLKAAALLQAQQHIHFIFVGDGAGREQLMAMASQHHLSNVTFFPLQFHQEVDLYWHICDVALVHLKDRPIFSGALPLKMFTAIAAGLPIILSLPKGEASDFIAQLDNGVWVMPEQASALADAVLALSHDKQQLQKFAANSSLAAKQYTRERQATEMLALITQVIAQP